MPLGRVTLRGYNLGTGPLCLADLTGHKRSRIGPDHNLSRIMLALSSKNDQPTRASSIVACESQRDHSILDGRALQAGYFERSI